MGNILSQNTLTLFYISFAIGAIANLTPVFAAKLLKNLSYPLDFNKTYRGKRILGDHKTVRGYILGILMAQLTYVIIINSFDLNIQLPIIYGALIGFGALTGDSVKSFFKRQLNIPPGVSWIPWDQIDWIIGICIINMFFISDIQQHLTISVLLIVIGFISHLISKFLGYYLKLNTTRI